MLYVIIILSSQKAYGYIFNGEGKQIFFIFYVVVVLRVNLNADLVRLKTKTPTGFKQFKKNTYFMKKIF